MKRTALVLATAAFVASASSSNATLIYGLTSSNGLISFDSATPGTINNIGTISQPGIIDIDFFPVNNVLYGLTSTGSTFSINLTTAAATLLFNPGSPLSGLTDFDFNPVADRIRLFGDVDQNYRMVPDVITAPSVAAAAGGVTVDGTFSNTSFQLVANAYSNNFDSASTTTLFSIDTVTDSLIIHSVAPAFNTVTAVGSLGVAVGTAVGLDVGQDGITYLSDGNSLYTVNLSTGSATSIGTVGGTGLVSVAVVAPEPSAALLGLTGLAALGARRRRRA